MRDTRSRYGTGSIRQRGRIFWVRFREVLRRPDGVVTYVQHMESTGSKDREFAERYLRQKLLALGGRRPLQVDPKAVTYEDLCANGISHAVEANSRSLTKDKDGNPTISTLSLLDRYFGGWKAADITAAAIRRFRREGKDHKKWGGRPRGDKRMNRCVATLRSMFRLALKDELITSAEMPAYFPTTHEPNEAQGALFIQPEWYAPLREELSEPLRSAFTLAYHTSIRVGELRRICWRDVDLQKKQIHLSSTNTKTKRQRMIFIPEDFDLKPGKPNDLVFPLADIRDEWHQACIKIGAGHFECNKCGERCEERKCPTHGHRTHKQMRYVGPTLRHTRHTAIRNMADAGLDERRIMDTSGHVTRSTFDRYNIGKEKDVAETRRVMEEFHKRRSK